MDVRGRHWSFQSNQIFTFIDLGATIGTYNNIITGLASDSRNKQLDDRQFRICRDVQFRWSEYRSCANDRARARYMVRRRASFRRARLHAAPAIRACARQTLSLPAHSTVRAAILALDDYEEAAQGGHLLRGLLP